MKTSWTIAGGRRQLAAGLLLGAVAAATMAIGGTLPAALKSIVITDVSDAARARGLISAGSCSASACHGGDNSAPAMWKKSYSIWAVKDRHARAYAVLSGQLAEQIEHNWLADGEREPRPAWRDTRCLGCHADASSEHADPQQWSDGVSCQSCHGAANRWLVPHTLKTFSDDDRQRLGMRNLKDFTARAESCVACHVGSAAKPGEPFPREVNHDLIAAGHPRLNFELTAFLANMPPHWNRREDEATLWAVGQVVATRTAVANWPNARARPSTGRAWPEFAEYSCYGCHQSLMNATRSTGAPRHTEDQQKVEPRGNPRWGSWHTPLAEAVTDACKSGETDNRARESKGGRAVARCADNSTAAGCRGS